MAPIQFRTEDDEGNEIIHDLPTKYEVCPRCDGRGKHVNPNVDGPGISAEEFAEDPDFAQDYFEGVFDVRCEECNGLRVVAMVDEDKCKPEVLEAYRLDQEAEADYRRQMEHERVMGY